MKKVTLHTDEVLPQLSQVVSVVAQKNSMPILDNVLFETSGGVLKMTTSDSAIWLRMNANIIESDEDTRFCLDARNILATLRNLAGEVVTIDVEDTNIKGKYANGNFSMPFNDAKAFPMPNNIEKEWETNIGSRNLLQSISTVMFAVDNDEIRVVLNGVNMDFSDIGITCAATDGKKLAKYVDSSLSGEIHVTRNFIITTKTARLLTAILKDTEKAISIIANSTTVTFTDNDTFTLVARLIEGHYPNYNAVIPQDVEHEAVIDTEKLACALRRIMPLGNEKYSLVKFSFDTNKLTISAENIDFSTSAQEYMECEYSGAPMAIGFNGNDLLLILRSTDSQKVRFKFTAPERPGVFLPIQQGEGTEYISVLMPMRLDK